MALLHAVSIVKKKQDWSELPKMINQGETTNENF
jgi:hypothetical protein